MRTLEDLQAELAARDLGWTPETGDLVWVLQECNIVWKPAKAGIIVAGAGGWGCWLEGETASGSDGWGIESLLPRFGESV